MARLLRSVRKAFKLWRSMPDTERERYRAHVERIRALVAELGGPSAVRYVEGAGDEVEARLDSETNPRRPRKEAIADLKNETASLIAALAPSTAALVKTGVPRSARLGGKLAGKGIRMAARRYGR
jgi:hypothetical protein